EALEEKIQALPSGSALNLQNIPSKLPASVSLFEKNPKAQSLVVMSYRGLSLRDPERDTLQVLQSLLAGQGGRLFIELRDRASLAYTVAPVKMEGLETGCFGAYIGCSPEKVLKAIEMMKIEFQKLMQSPVPEIELERSKRYLMGRSVIDLQKNPAQANAIHYAGIYDLDPMDAFQFAERLQKVSARQVQNLAQKIFSGPHVLSVVGPEDPWSSN
ncbi:MAG: insulinase family protein, partial [Bdellovibrio sp.]